jgi:hypothetical protein
LAQKRKEYTPKLLRIHIEEIKTLLKSNNVNGLSPSTLASGSDPFGLTNFEKSVLILCAAAELDNQLPPITAPSKSSPKNFTYLPKASAAEMALPKQGKRLLTQITAEIKNKKSSSNPLTVNSMFAGPSSPEKTLAAKILANNLQLKLFRIDLSSVVSAYIGETEKNLRKLFDAAESGGAILFFDEADALFGKRRKTSNTQQRYANIKTNYLLESIENYVGISILSVSSKKLVDEDFLKRMNYIIPFPFPDA